MELILKGGLPHQQIAIESICNVFDENCIKKTDSSFSNPIIDIKNEIIAENIKKVQVKVHPEIRGNSAISDYLSLDIKMETGTGKTYAYVASIYELHKRYKINKYIIVVPTLPIKAGTKQFIEDPYVIQHFRDECKYGTEIELQILESKPKKKGRNYFPGSVREFVQGSKQNSNKIFVLLANMAMFTNSKQLTDDYDAIIDGFSQPVDAIKGTKPFVIIDEPHRFSKDQKAFEFITNNIKPQCIIRFGATFPYIETGKGKNKKSIKDYHNLLYDLNACDAFNQNLIKGISKEHFEPLSKREEKIKISSIAKNDAVNLTFIQKDKVKISKELKKGDSLSIISDELSGIEISGIGSNYIELSNGQIKFQGEEFSTDIYSSSYQEQMLRLAIERHFETEKINFNRKFKIKTLALFFIDDITSYRSDEKTGKATYLKDSFEKLLLERIDIELSNLSNIDNKEYEEYLLASKADVSSCHAGYFSQDNSDSDAEIEKEVYEILFGKKELLSIKTKDGKFNTRRFLFSKWTLKEGWDNPNVFTIAKLRSSGSDISKIQEVGRGLRLPVDENGNRISNEEFRLNYIVDFTESDFAEKLVKEINDELPTGFIITNEKLEIVAKKLNITKNELFKKLIVNDYIDMDNKINPDKINDFFVEYPDFSTGVNTGKITNRNTKTTTNIKIRPAVYNELKQLWESINHKYLLYYDKIEENYFLKNEIVKLFKKDVFVNVIMSSSRQNVEYESETKQMGIVEGSGVQYVIEKTINYNEFLKRINRQTNLPIKLIHDAFASYSKDKSVPKNQINEFSVINFIRKFNEWKNEELQSRFKYKKSNIKLTSTALTSSNGKPLSEITQGRVGTKLIKGTPNKDKYLYDTFAYDSNLERENLTTGDIEEIIVYGKIPRNSIRIPTITGGTYSPDFMYVIKKINGEKSLNIVVETKDKEDETDLSGEEKMKIKCAEVFFQQISDDGYKVEFHKQLNNKKIKQIIDEVLIK